MSAQAMPKPSAAFDPLAARASFDILSREVYGKPLVYLDNAASAQKPNAVLERMTEAYKSEYANVHRGLHYLANDGLRELAIAAAQRWLAARG